MLKQLEAGRKVGELAREIGVSEATLYTWKSKYGGMEVSGAEEFRALRDENSRLKKLVANREGRSYAPAEGGTRHLLQVSVWKRGDSAVELFEST